MRDLKYLAALSIPLVALLSVNLKGVWSFATPVFAFVVLPVLELILPIDERNLDEKTIQNKLKNKLFDWLLYLNLPIVYGILFYGLKTVTSYELQTYEIVGLVFSVGIVLGVNGINVGHELGHRQKSKERFIGKALLLPSFYMHFYIEHNHGHHRYVATLEDPATARYNQSVYSFWFTSTIGQYLSAWKIQNTLIKKNNWAFISFNNDMFWSLIIEISYLICIYIFFSPFGLLFSVLAATVGITLLETVNYIEHYGLLRIKTKSGRYERVKEIHSWNSNHIIGRIVLYELTRHSDHHFKASKKYQVLNCHKESPQMPFGYPTSMVISLFPPVWFKVMNKRVPPEMIIT